MPKSTQATTLYQKIIFSLGGFLIGMLIIMVLLKIFSNVWGILIGVLINSAVFYYFIKKKSNQKDKMIIAYGILSAIILTIVVGTGLWIFVEMAFQDIAA